MASIIGERFDVAEMMRTREIGIFMMGKDAAQESGLDIARLARGLFERDQPPPHGRRDDFAEHVFDEPLKHSQFVLSASDTGSGTARCKCTSKKARTRRLYSSPTK